MPLTPNDTLSRIAETMRMLRVRSAEPSKVNELRDKMAAIKKELETIFTVVAITPTEYPVDWQALECLNDAASNLGSFLALTESKGETK